MQINNNYSLLADVLVLDNSFSWTKGKTVYYMVDILSGNDDDSFTSALDVANDDEPVADFL